MNMPKPFKQLGTLVYKASKALRQLLYDGGLSIVCPNQDEAIRVLGQLKATVS